MLSCSLSELHVHAGSHLHVLVLDFDMYTVAAARLAFGIQLHVLERALIAFINIAISIAIGRRSQLDAELGGTPYNSGTRTHEAQHCD